MMIERKGRPVDFEKTQRSGRDKYVRRIRTRFDINCLKRGTNICHKRTRITYLRIINPLLIPLATVTRIEDDIGAAVIQARLVSTDLAGLAQHPVLWQTIKINVRGFWPALFAYDRWFWQPLRHTFPCIRSPKDSQHKYAGDKRVK